jgi:hypothetical protein
MSSRPYWCCAISNNLSTRRTGATQPLTEGSSVAHTDAARWISRRTISAPLHGQLGGRTQLGPACRFSSSLAYKFRASRHSRFYRPDTVVAAVVAVHCDWTRAAGDQPGLVREEKQRRTSRGSSSHMLNSALRCTCSRCTGSVVPMGGGRPDGRELPVTHPARSSEA